MNTMTMCPAYETPERFVLVHADYGTIILSGWFGHGMAGSDSWRLSTPIAKVEMAEVGVYEVTTGSGSVYQLMLDRYGMTSLTADVFEYRRNQAREGQGIFDVVELEHVCSSLLAYV